MTTSREIRPGNEEGASWCNGTLIWGSLTGCVQSGQLHDGVLKLTNCVLTCFSLEKLSLMSLRKQALVACD